MKSILLDNTGKPITSTSFKPSKQALGLYGSIYSYPNWGKFRPRYYTLGDTSQGLDTISRELLVRWSREMTSQLPFVQTAIKALADFSIGNTYLPVYKGTNKEWWKTVETWLLEDWYPNCNTRGSHYDFQTSLRIESQLIDTDGDYLVVFGTENGYPKYQIIQNNRIKSQYNDGLINTEGAMKGAIVSDGIYYTPQGKPIGYAVYNANNLVSEMASITNDMVFSTRDAHLVLDPQFIDKLRGVPAIGAAILQALSIQELDSYLMEKLKIESTIALVEKTPSGQAPVELQNTLEQLMAQTGTQMGNVGNLSPNTHALGIVQGSEIRYVHAEGGEIKTLGSNSPNNEAQDYIARLETQVLATIGTPHQLIYSTDRVSGRATSGVAEMFRAAISRRQGIMDKTAKLRVAWAIVKAMQLGIIPENYDENVSKVIDFTHPPEFSLDARYDNDIVTTNYQSGFSSLNEATTKLYNKTAEATLDEQTNEQIMFYKRAKKVSEETGVDLPTILSGWRYQQKTTRPPEAADTTPGNPDSVVTK